MGSFIRFKSHKKGRRILKKFSEMNLSRTTRRTLKESKFILTTPVQSLVIPKLMTGKSVAVQSKTGTGKTLAYAIPLVEQIENSKGVQALVLCPTRELALQVSEQFNVLLKYRHQRAVTLYGGQKIGIQFKALKRGNAIVVGTPGRVIDHLKRGTLRLKNLKTFVLDEADEMLNMGFLEDVRKILRYAGSEKQGVLLSATMNKEVVKLGRELQRNMEFFMLSKDELIPSKAKQYYFKVKEKDKSNLMLSFLSRTAPKNVMVFCNTKKKVEEVAGFLKSKGINADSIHGDLRQFSRERVMKKFRSGRTKVLVATDVAARGIDLTVETIVNYDLPTAKSYVHRIGRTARMGKKGYAYAFVTPREKKELSLLKKYIRSDIEMVKLPL